MIIFYVSFFPRTRKRAIFWWTNLIPRIPGTRLDENHPGSAIRDRIKKADPFLAGWFGGVARTLERCLATYPTVSSEDRDREHPLDTSARWTKGLATRRLTIALALPSNRGGSKIARRFVTGEREDRRRQGERSFGIFILYMWLLFFFSFLNDFLIFLIRETFNVWIGTCYVFVRYSFVGRDVQFFVFNDKIRLINIGDNLRKIFGYVLFKSLDQIWVLIKACRICINFGLDWNYNGG